MILIIYGNYYTIALIRVKNKGPYVRYEFAQVIHSSGNSNKLLGVFIVAWKDIGI
jgi:hypothetical protein